jgi:hypothetical protein
LDRKRDDAAFAIARVLDQGDAVERADTAQLAADEVAPVSGGDGDVADAVGVERRQVPLQQGLAFEVQQHFRGGVAQPPPDARRENDGARQR